MTRKEAIQSIKSWDFLGEKEREVIETLVPELKESENEKIKKQIIYAIKQLPVCDETKSKCIAWLEKKGGCKMSHDDEIMIKQLTEYFTTGFGLQNTNETIVAWLRDLKEKLSGLGEQKSVNSTLQEKADIDNAFTEMMLKGEQKSVNKVKIGERYICVHSPRYTCFMVGDIYEVKDSFMAALIDLCSDCFKFYELADVQNINVGDWIISEHKDVHKDYAVCMIARIENDRYYLDKGGYLTKDAIRQYGYRLWTLQDAKKGDILDDGSAIFILEKINTTENVSAVYCCLFDDGDFSVGFNLSFWKEGITPASKYRRDMLFRKIHDEGLVWDAEELKLNKIK